MGAGQVLQAWLCVRERKDLVDRIHAGSHEEYRKHCKPAAPSRPECLDDEELANREELRRRGKKINAGIL